MNLFAWIDPSSGLRAHRDSLLDGKAHVSSHHAIFSEIACGQLGKNEPAARACATVGEYDALPGLDATTRRQRHVAWAAARPWRLDVGCPSSWRPSRGSRSRVLEQGKSTKSRAGHGVPGSCREQPTEATRRRAGKNGAPITSAPRLDLDSQAAIIVVCLLWLRKRPLVRVRARTHRETAWWNKTGLGGRVFGTLELGLPRETGAYTRNSAWRRSALPSSDLLGRTRDGL